MLQTQSHNSKSVVSLIFHYYNIKAFKSKVGFRVLIFDMPLSLFYCFIHSSNSLHFKEAIVDSCL